MMRIFIKKSCWIICWNSIGKRYVSFRKRDFLTSAIKEMSRNGMMIWWHSYVNRRRTKKFDVCISLKMQVDVFQGFCMSTILKEMAAQRYPKSYMQISTSRKNFNNIILKWQLSEI